MNDDLPERPRCYLPSSKYDQLLVASGQRLAILTCVSSSRTALYLRPAAFRLAARTLSVNIVVHIVTSHGGVGCDTGYNSGGRAGTGQTLYREMNFSQLIGVESQLYQRGLLRVDEEARLHLQKYYHRIDSVREYSWPLANAAAI